MPPPSSSPKNHKQLSILPAMVSVPVREPVLVLAATVNTTFIRHWHAACERPVSAIGSQASNKSSGHHPKNVMNRHRSIVYIGGDFGARQAFGEVAAAENYRVVSAAHLQNALLEFGTDQIDGDRIDRMQKSRSVGPEQDPERNRPHNLQNHRGVARVSNASLLAWTTALPI